MLTKMSLTQRTYRVFGLQMAFSLDSSEIRRSFVIKMVFLNLDKWNVPFCLICE